MTTWRKELIRACKENKESFDDLTHTLTDKELDKKFDEGYGIEEGCSFTAWSNQWVYFPACYDGSEWVACVPRNPSEYKTSHIGGG